jgi:hypothetical protein
MIQVWYFGIKQTERAESPLVCQHVERTCVVGGVRRRALRGKSCVASLRVVSLSVEAS